MKKTGSRGFTVGFVIGIGVAIAIGFFRLGRPIGTAIAIPVPTPKVAGLTSIFGSGARLPRLLRDDDLVAALLFGALQSGIGRPDDAFDGASLIREP